MIQCKNSDLTHDLLIIVLRTITTWKVILMIKWRKHRNIWVKSTSDDLTYLLNLLKCLIQQCKRQNKTPDQTASGWTFSRRSWCRPCSWWRHYQSPCPRTWACRQSRPRCGIRASMRRRTSRCVMAGAEWSKRLSIWIYFIFKFNSRIKSMDHKC